MAKIKTNSTKYFMDVEKIEFSYHAGPDYIKDHLTKVHQHTSYIGEKLPALEKTGDLRYLWRPAPNRSLPAKYKYEYVGEVGWGIPEYDFINQTRLQTGFQIKCGELNQATIDKISHRYQNPWQPKPDIMDMQGKYSRGFIAWHMGNYENTNERNSKGAVLVRQSTAALPRASRSPKLPKLPRKEEFLLTYRNILEFILDFHNNVHTVEELQEQYKVKHDIRYPE
nr:uncharacterized protein C4orf45 homolog [Mirounga angustirostris]